MSISQKIKVGTVGLIASLLMGNGLVFGGNVSSLIEDHKGHYVAIGDADRYGAALNIGPVPTSTNPNLRLSNNATSYAHFEMDAANNQLRIDASVNNNWDNGNILLTPNGGVVGIGSTTLVEGYQLTVDGGIYALDLRIRPDLSNTADFVFDKDYPLMPLEDVESSIKANKHLPGIPSAEDMVEHGVSVNEMQGKLLQKIEELTLHLIDQNKRLNAQEEELKMFRLMHNTPEVALNN